MYRNMIEKYSVSKTLRFELIPQGKTLENIKNSQILDEAIKKNGAYKRLKPIIDDYYKVYSDEVLGKFQFSSKGIEELEEYYNISTLPKLDAKQKKTRENIEQNLKKEIVDYIKRDNAEQDSVFGKNLLGPDGFLAKYLKSINEFSKYESDLREFNRFATFFTTGLLKNRSYIFSDIKEGSISYRSINDNLNIFIKNMEIFNKYNEQLLKFDYSELNKQLSLEKIEDIFLLNDYDKYISSQNINTYNTIISGFSLEKTSNSKQKIKGLNEFINEHNQIVEKKDRIPLLKQLKKQILSESTTFSFVFDIFETEEDIYYAVLNYKTIIEESLPNLLNQLQKLDEFDLDNIYISSININYLSNLLRSDFSYINDLISNDYDKNYEGKKKRGTNAYQDEKKTYLKNINSYSINSLSSLLVDFDLLTYLKSILSKDKFNEITNKMNSILKEYKEILKENKKLIDNSSLFDKFKETLDELKELDRLLKLLLTTENQKDVFFYNIYEENYEYFSNIDVLYNKCRNYFTKKAFSTEKIKVFFNKPSLLTGWSKSKEEECGGIILLKDNKYFLVILENNKAFRNIESNINGEYKKMNLTMIPGASKQLNKIFFSKTHKELYKPSDYILEGKELGKMNQGENFDRKFMEDFIDFCKKSISLNKDWDIFDFKFSDNSMYKNIGDFYKEVDQQSYNVSFDYYKEEDIVDLVEKGEIHLFQIYNKDFSEYSKGTPNLHTMYFKELFSKENMINSVYKLNGNAEIFYRKKSLNKVTIHEKNVEIKNKNPHNKNKTSKFKYDLIKNKRYLSDKFLFHVPITFNHTLGNNFSINNDIKENIKNNDNVNVIGIDRGERNLLYVTVIDSKGNILEQLSLNNIVNEYNNNIYSFDYHKKLVEVEKERDAARKDWKSIGTIKELKDGYMSAVINKIAYLVDKYQAIIIMEDLNLGFKNSRVKVERAVYQKFEKALIDKFNYLIFKTRDYDSVGGLRKAYQLTPMVDNYSSIQYQVGNIFYVNPWNTSKIDPTTGYTKLLNTKRYRTLAERKEFIDNIDDIRFNETENYYEFDIDYKKYKDVIKPSKTKWTICSNGNRIENYKESNTKYRLTREVNITDEINKFLDENNILKHNIKEGILNLNSSDLYGKFLHLLDLVMQLRNTSSDSSDLSGRDQILSPVKNKMKNFYNTDNNKNDLPKDADANGAYCIALKGLMLVDRIHNSDDSLKINNAIKNEDWMNYLFDRAA